MTYGDQESDYAYAVVETADQGIIVGGSVALGEHSSWMDGWLVKLAPDGTIAWHKAYGDDDEQAGVVYDIEQTEDGDLILASWAGVRKVTAEGELIWQYNMYACCSTYFDDLLLTQDDGFIAVGTTTFNTVRLQDIWVAKFDENGIVQWQKTFGTTASDYGKGIAQGSDGGYIVAGMERGSRGWLISLTSDGELRWQKTLNGPHFSTYLESIVAVDQEDFLIAGAKDGHPWLARIDGDGVFVWQKSLDIDGGIHSAKVMSDGNIAAVGSTYGNENGGLLVRMTSNGALLLERHIDGGRGTGGFNDFTETANGDFILVGYSGAWDDENKEDFWVVRVDDEGRILRCPAIRPTGATLSETNVTLTDTVVLAVSQSYSLTASSFQVFDHRLEPNLACPLPHLSISKTGPAFAWAGDQITYSIKVTNNSTATLTGVVISDVLPVGSSYYNGGTLIENEVQWVVPAITPTQTLTRSFSIVASNDVVNSGYCVSCSEGYRSCGDQAIETSVDTMLFLPALMRQYCADFFDDFSDPSSGWPVGEDSYVQAGYITGEYRIRSKQSGYIYLFESPSCHRTEYVAEVNGRWEGATGASYGLVVGIKGDFYEFYLFEINTDVKAYRVLHVIGDDYSWKTGQSSAIAGGTAWNHLKALLEGGTMHFYVNGTQVTDWSYLNTGELTGVGVAAGPYSDRPVSDARFDNFVMRNLTSAEQVGVTTTDFNPAEAVDSLAAPQDDVLWPTPAFWHFSESDRR